MLFCGRLSENPDYTVGVIEAGDYHEHEPEVTVPGSRPFTTKRESALIVVPQV